MALFRCGGNSEIALNPTLTSQVVTTDAQSQTVTGFMVGKHYCLTLSHSSNWSGFRITSGAEDVVGLLNGQTYSSGDSYVKTVIFKASSTSVVLETGANCSSCLIQLD